MTDPAPTIQCLSSTWRRDLDLFMAERAPGMNAYMLSRTRLASVMRMHAMSDAELAGLGLRRADIPAFVFEDILHD